MTSHRSAPVRIALFMIACFLMVADEAHAQLRRRGRDNPTTRELEARAEQAETVLVQELVQVAEDYYKIGNPEKSRDILQRVLRINRDVPGVKEKIDDINRELVEANGTVVELDASAGWGDAVAILTPGKPYRIEAAGSYSLEFRREIGVDGLPTADAQRDHVALAPFGSLIGVIVTDGKPGDPFLVKTGIEETAKNGGQLYLRVNAPADATCTGTLKLQLSGQIQVNPRRARKTK